MRLFGISFRVDAFEENNMVICTGIRYDSLKRYVKAYYNSGTFLDKFVSRSWSNSLKFHKFFVPEFVFLLQNGIKEGYLPTYQTQKLIDRLCENTWYKDTFIECKSPVDMTVSKYINPDFKLTSVQLEFIRDIYYQKKTQYHLKGYLLALEQGLGKAGLNTDKIKIPGGWTTYGTVKVGDTVTAVDGGTTTVTGVYPQGMQPMYRVAFIDGRHVDVAADHLWTIQVTGNVAVKERVMTTAELFRWMCLSTHQERTFIPLCESECIPDAELPIDPYTLGVLIGDGGLHERALCMFTDQEVISRVVSKNPFMNLTYKKTYKSNCEYYRVARIKLDSDGQHRIRDGLRQVKLLGAKSWNKFIPEMYLNASHKQRIELLRGLCDTDGYVSDPTTSSGRTGKPAKCGTVEYSTSSEQLAKDVQQLVWSLGGKCSISSRIPIYTYKEERKPGRVSYRVKIKLRNPADGFTLERKKCRLTSEHQYTSDWKLRVSSVTPMNKKAECTCISVADPRKLYITNNYIVTHNTMTSLFLAEALHKKHVIITCPLSVINSVWINEIDKVFMTDRNHLVWTSDDDVSKLTVNTKYVIMNYESIGKIAPMLLKLFKGHESMVVIDEWHNFKDINSLRTNNLIDFCSAFKCNDILPMSGTPIKALGIETLPLFKLLDEYYNADIEARLKTMNKFTKVMNDLLCNRLGFTMYRKLKKDVLKDLPDKHEEDLPVTIPNGEYYTLTNVKKLVVEFTAERRIFYKEHFKEFAAIYEECLKLFEKTLHTQLEWNEYKTYLKNVAIIQKSGYGWDNIEYIKQANIYEKHVIVPGLPVNMRAKFKASKSVVKYVELKILGEVLGGLLNSLRAEMSAAMIGEEVLDKIRTADKKTILFSSYRDTIDVAKTVCVKNGMKPVIITGDNSREAGEIIKKFTEDDELNPLISSTKAVSVGHTIIIANTVIFLNTPYRSTDYDQASDRVYRIGQDTDVYIYKLVLDTGGEPNLSTRMHDIIAWSKEQFGTIMGDITDDDTGISNSEAKIKGIIDTANTEDTSTITNLLSGMYNNIKNKLTK